MKVVFKSASRLWTWFQRAIGRTDIYGSKGVYMRRWVFPPMWSPKRLAELLPGLRLHNIRRSDEDDALHDHPFSFLSIIVAGGYYEHTADGWRRWHGPGSIVVRKAEALHRLELRKIAPSLVECKKEPCVCHEEVSAWTIVLRGRIRRPWGFVPKGGEWTPWREFIAKKEARGAEAGEFAAASSL